MAAAESNMKSLPPEDPIWRILGILQRKNLDRKSPVKVKFNNPYNGRIVLEGSIEGYVGTFCLKDTRGKIVPIPWSAIRDVRPK